MTTTIIHGSSITYPATARDVDAVYVGDRVEAASDVARWTAGHGLGHLPVDLRRAELIDGAAIIPSPFGEEAPYHVIAGSTAVMRRTPEGLAARMRAKGFNLGSFDAFFNDHLARFGLVDGCRGTIDDPDGMEWSPEWQSYVEGPTALRSALCHVRADVWSQIRQERPALAALVDALAEHGSTHLHPGLLHRIGGQAGGDPQTHIAVTGGVVRPLHGATEQTTWAAAEFAAAIRGERPNGPTPDTGTEVELGGL